MARPVTFVDYQSPYLSSANLNGMQDALRSNYTVHGSQGSPATGAAAAVTVDFVPGAQQLHGLVHEIFAGATSAFILETASVAQGEESWLTIVFRQVGGPWELGFARSPINVWTILTEGDAALTPSTTADTIDIFDLWTPNGTDWFGAVTKAWS